MRAFDRVHAGGQWRPPSADQQNAWTEAAESFQQRQRTGNHRPNTTDRRSDLVIVTNNTGANRRRGDVVQIGDMKLDDDRIGQHEFYFEGDTPTVSNIRKHYAILRNPIPTTSPVSTGQAYMYGICPAYVNVISTGHNRAHIKNGEFRLTSGLFGEWEIVYKPASSTGEQMCAVRFAPAAPRLCVWLPSGETVPARSDDTMTRTSSELDVFTVVGEFGDSTLDLEPLVDDSAQQVSVHVYGFHNDTAIAGNRFLLIEPLDRNIPIVTLSPCATDTTNGE